MQYGILMRNLLLLSALLYSFSFIIPQLQFAILFFTLPLYNRHLTFFNGFFWGIVALGIHASGILYATMRMQEGPWIGRIIPTLCIIFYLALHTGLWFVILEISKRFMIPVTHTLLVTPLIHSLFFWYLSYGCFLPVYGAMEGYPFANPLLCMLSCDIIKICISYTGFLCTLFIFFFFIGMPALVKEKFSVLIYVIIFIATFLAPSRRNQSIPHYLPLIAPFPMQFSYTNSSLYPLECLQEHHNRDMHKNIIISPESAFYCYPLFTHESLRNLNTPGVTYIVGSFSQNDLGIYNTLYLIRDGKMCGSHHKQHTVLSESVPWLLSFIPGINQPCKKGFSIKKAPKKHDVWYLDTITFEPYTCSELFCHFQPMHSPQKGSVVLLCCNDSWFTSWTQYASQLMVRDAIFKALLWHKDVLYIGYQNALLISTQGTVSKIAQ